MIEVLNLRDGGSGVYVGRGGRGLKGSALANPFKMRSEAERVRVVGAYRAWLWAQVQRKEGEVWNELVRLAQMHQQGQAFALVCWCSPRRCHAEVIRDCVEWMVRTEAV
jgi:hypothetical protein